MTLEEAVKDISDELRAAGFQVSDYQGFPLAQTNLAEGMDAHMERVRLLKFRTRIPCDRRIYAEGMIFIPHPTTSKRDGG
jgi:hypothetical protein